VENSETFDIIGMAKRVDANIKRRRIARTIAGVGLAAIGIIRGGRLAPFIVLGGAVLVVRGVTDQPLKDTWERLVHSVRAPRGRVLRNRSMEEMVDEASWQSFPASDPPGYHLGTSATPQR
jgi:hypothetical protein